MANVTVTQFAAVLKVPVDKLLSQLGEAGIKVDGSDDIISDDAKLELLTFLRRSHGINDGSEERVTPTKITLKRKSQIELKLASSQGRSRTVNVEVRKKRTYVKKDVLEDQVEQERKDIELKKKQEQEKIEAELLEKKKQEQDKVDAERIAKELKNKPKESSTESTSKLKFKEQKENKKEKSYPNEEKDRRKKERKKKKQDISETRYGRAELHVAGDKSGRRKKKPITRRRAVSIEGESQHGFEKPTAPVVREIMIPDSIKVSDLAQRIAVKGNEVVKILFNMGTMVTINEVIDQDTAILVVEELGHIAKAEEGNLEENVLKMEDEKGEKSPRAPVVTIMGHVDHGKTSLLDYIKKSKVVDGEAGGITQHIGAYNVETEKGNITFLDTPGHAAFTAMRARGAQVTDIVILVVAADDGVKPQTIEAIEHTNAAKVPMIVAINKIDKEDIDIERVKTELSNHKVISEEWGGEHLFASVSAQNGDGINDLLEKILLQAEVMDLKATKEGPARGVVIESSLDKGRGVMATLLVQSGTLSKGDIVLAGNEFGKIRSMLNETQQQISSAGPSTPLIALGLPKIPISGENFYVVKNERQARELAENRKTKSRELKIDHQQNANIDDIFSQIQDINRKLISILIKSDVHGSSEALSDAIRNLKSDEVSVKVIGSGVGGITESDVVLAAASNAMIIGFNVRADSTARSVIKDSEVDVRYYSIIYEAIDDVKAAINGMLSPEVRENIIGLAEVKEVFKSPKLGNIAGSIVTEGYVKRTNPIRVLRDNVVIYEGELESLRRFKDDAKEVQSGTECGIGVKNYNDVKIGDQIECYERIEIARTID
ncbi:MAG TPA: translation initiation factor IF-2 [Woeseiaceae bacterium]|nr:translation initiation factor IF-2 [Woeseiaceae bacterium]